MSKVTVRRAEQADLETLTAQEPRPELRLAQRRFDEMQAGTGILAVAEVDGALAGSGFLDFEDEELNPEVKNLWVFPKARRQGAGKALWSWLEEQARDAGHKEVFLSVAPDNASAVAMFMRLGYSPTGHHQMVTNPSAHEVPATDGEPIHYAIYRKSLLAY